MGNPLTKSFNKLFLSKFLQNGDSKPPTKSFYELFLSEFLQNGERKHYIGPTVNSLWVVQFMCGHDFFERVSNLGNKCSQWSDTKKEPFIYSRYIAAKYVETTETNGVRPMFLARAITIPGEGVSITRPDQIKYGSGLAGTLAGPRQHLKEINVNFLLTDYSFVDLILRPWSIAISQFGTKLPDLRTNLECVMFTKVVYFGDKKSEWAPKLTYRFKNIFPSIGGNLELGYRLSDVDKVIHMKFQYDDYEIVVPTNMSKVAVKNTKIKSTDEYDWVADGPKKERKVFMKTDSGPIIYNPFGYDKDNWDTTNFWEVQPQSTAKKGPGFLKQASDLVAKASQLTTQYLGGGIASKIGLTKANTIINIAKRYTNANDQDADVPPPGYTYKGGDGHGHVWKASGSHGAKVSPGSDRTKHLHLIDEALALASRTLSKSVGAINYDTSLGGTGGTQAAINGRDVTGGKATRFVRVSPKDTITYPISKQNDITVRLNDTSDGGDGGLERTVSIADTPDAMNLVTRSVSINQNDRPLTNQIPLNDRTINGNDVSTGKSIKSKIVNISEDDMGSGDKNLRGVVSSGDDARESGEAVSYQDVSTSKNDTPKGGSITSNSVVIGGNDVSTGDVASKQVEIATNDVVSQPSNSGKHVSINSNDFSRGSDIAIKNRVETPTSDTSRGGDAKIVTSNTADTPRDLDLREVLVASETKDYSNSADVEYKKVSPSSNDISRGDVSSKIVNSNKTNDVPKMESLGAARIVSVKMSDVSRFAKAPDTNVHVKGKPVGESSVEQAKIVAPSKSMGGNSEFGETKIVNNNLDVPNGQLSTYKEVWSQRRQAMESRTPNRST